MAFLVDTQELKTGLIIFRRADVKHRNWYCRIKVPDADVATAMRRVAAFLSTLEQAVAKSPRNKGHKDKSAP